MLETLRERETSFSGFAMERAQQARDYFLAQPMSPARGEFFEHLAAESREQQRAIEAADTQSFDEYVAAWYR